MGSIQAASETLVGISCMLVVDPSDSGYHSQAAARCAYRETT